MRNIRSLIVAGCLLAVLASSSASVSAQRRAADDNRDIYRKPAHRVLYLESVPRWEFRFLRNLLERDKAVNLDVYLASSDVAAGRKPGAEPTFLRDIPATAEALAAYDVIILGDLPRGFLEKHSRELPHLLRRFVTRQGGAVIFLPGQRFSPDDWLTDLTPVVFDADAKQISLREPASLTLTEAGGESGLVRLDDDAATNAKLWRELPPVHSVWPVSKVKDRATVLVTMPAAGDKPAMPLIVHRAEGAGQCLWIGADETWRWRKQKKAAHHQRFWRQVVLGMCQSLGKPDRDGDPPNEQK